MARTLVDTVVAIARRIPWVLAALLVCTVTMPASVSAQSRPEVTGRVVDATGGVLAGATVTVRSTSGTTREALSATDGRYRVSGLTPGSYELRISLDGFADFVRTVDAGSGRSSTVDATLQILVRERVEVNSGDSVFSDASASGFTVSGRELAAMPNDPRAFAERLQALAGAGLDGDQAPVSVDGFRPGGRIPPKSAIQLIRFNTNPYAAEFAEPGRGQIEVITKPGAANVSGELDGTFNDSSMNATNALATRRAPVQSRTLSGYLSGPVIKNRWGFQLFGGHWMRDAESLINATVLDPAGTATRSLVATVGTPARTRSISGATDVLLAGRHRVAATFDYVDERSNNLGLGSGLDLPERAYSRTQRTPSANIAVSSVGKAGADNELRVEWRQSTSATRASATGPAVLVLDAFNAGANQQALFRDNVNGQLALTDRLTMTHGRLRLKMGVDFVRTRNTQTDRSDFDGTYLFGADAERDATGAPVIGVAGQPIAITPIENYRRTLLGLPGYGPSQLTIDRGDPTVAYTQWLVAPFAQADWVASRNLTVSVGARYTRQTALSSRRDVGPRLSIARAVPGTKSDRIRLNAGLFHPQMSTDPLFNSLQFDGRRREHLLVTRPTFSVAQPATVPAGATAESESVYELPSTLSTPRVFAASLGYERNFSTRTNVSATYTGQFGRHLMWLGDVNAPPAGSLVRPQPDRGPVLVYQSSGRSGRHDVSLSARGSISSRVSIRLNYTVGVRRSDTEGPSSMPANPYNRAADYSYTDADRRHRLFSVVNVTLPWALTLGANIFGSSGRPFNLTTGLDNNGDGFFVDRPAFASTGDAGAVVTPLGVFNASPAANALIVPRNYGREPGQLRADLYLSRSFTRFGEQRPVTMTVTAGNVLNAANLTAVSGVVTSAGFMRARRALEPRHVDVSFSWTF